jgi:hypothetical protein
MYADHYRSSREAINLGMRATDRKSGQQMSLNACIVLSKGIASWLITSPNVPWSRQGHTEYHVIPHGIILM